MSTKEYRNKKHTDNNAYCISIELALIGGALQSIDAFREVQHLVTAEDLSPGIYRTMFTQLVTLSEQHRSFDMLVFAANLETGDSSNGFNWVLDVMASTPTGASQHLKSYISVITDYTRRRNLLTAAERTVETLKKVSIGNIDAVMHDVQLELSKVINAGSTKQQVPSLATIVPKDFRLFCEYFSKQNERVLSSGFGDLDSLITGFVPGNFYIIAGRPSMGKTSLALNIVENVTTQSQEKSVLMFSLEMAPLDIFVRLLSSKSNIPQSALRSGNASLFDNLPEINQAYKELAALNIYIDDSSTLSVAQMIAKTKQLYFQQKGNLSMIIVDYIQLMTLKENNNNYNRAQEIAEISKAFKVLARELDIPIIALSQLNRNLDERVDKRPTLSDLRDSGALEQDADTIIFLYRDEVYNKETNSPGIAELIVSKQRNGPIGKVLTAFRGEISSFRPLQLRPKPRENNLY